MPAFFDRYINLVEEENLGDALQKSLQKLEQLGSSVYAPGKWTIADIFQHLIDTERILAYRALCFSRGEQAVLPGFDEEEYAKNAGGSRRGLKSLIEEMILVRKTTIMMFSNFNETQIKQSGKSFKGSISVLALGFVIPGHQQHHFRVIKERYLPLHRQS